MLTWAARRSTQEGSSDCPPMSPDLEDPTSAHQEIPAQPLKMSAESMVKAFATFRGKKKSHRAKLKDIADDAKQFKPNGLPYYG
eukprot:13565675-Ditylum_brightwellii.AAC.1